ncbi:MAG: thioredoxin domain-containing protein [Verrucomicrobia bacterium]|jgi:uncharacterized membrane protein|nr:thioredoxin domain-containing protein [Verrucomicrobiota bacterium]MBT7066387.1 thioredoxin domain-containing protein [Verrucomicrobiota bacterium]MBT7701535.1 thioredoxin domain-containing protein [Verrucomicrobiota bacterium]
MLSSRPARVAIGVLSFIALAIAVYIMFVVKADQALPGCGEDECGAVLSSRWEQWGNIPVAHLGIGGYVSLITATVLTGVVRSPMLRVGLWAFMIVESLTGLGFITWLLLLQWLIIKQFCIFCLSSHLFGVAAYAIILWKAPAWHGFYHARTRLTGAAALLLVFLVTVHILVVPDMMAAQAAESLAPSDRAEEEALSTGMLQFGKKEASRTVRLLDDTLTFDLYKVPVSGDYDAEHVLVELSDYACPSCRGLHRKLTQFKEDYDVAMVIVHLLAPLNTACNPHIKKTPRGFENSCTYAQYAMAVNKADPTQFAAYHDYLMTGRFPPAPEEARRKAEAMVGKEALAAALEDEAVKEWITNGLNLKRYIKATTLPKLITRTQVVSYSGGSKAAFRQTMQKALNITGLEKRKH